MKRIARKSGELVGLLPKINPVWLACVPLSAIIFVVGNAAVHAQDAKPLTPEDVQNALNTIWVLIAAILVIFMNAGFAMLETGGCPHTAIREDASINLVAIEQLERKFANLKLIFLESGGDNLAATFSPELVDLTIYVIDLR